jgi:hypothetical protein
MVCALPHELPSIIINDAREGWQRASSRFNYTCSGFDALLAVIAGGPIRAQADLSRCTSADALAA